MRGGFHALIGSFAQFACGGDVAGLHRGVCERVEGEDLDGGVVVAGGVEDRAESLLRAGHAILRVERRQQAVTQRGLLSTPGVAVPRRSGFERRPRRRNAPERAEDAPEMDPGKCRQADVADRFGLLDGELQRGRTRRVVTGLALSASEAGDLVGLGLQKAEPARDLRRLADVRNRCVEPMVDPGQLAEHGVAADVEPRVVDDA